MDTIAVVDDRAAMRNSIAETIRLGLEDKKLDWRVIESEPLRTIDEYRDWLDENDVRVLILDERLNEEIAGQEAVDYTGHQVAAVVRRVCPDLPQLIVTAADSGDLEGAGDLDAVLHRKEFEKNSDVYLDRIVRLGRSYIERHEAELADLTRISERIVDGEVTEGDLARINAIRAKTQSDSPVVGLESVQDWIAKAEQLEAKLRAALDQVGNAQS